MSESELQEKVSEAGFVMSRPLGFNNTYALAVNKKFAAEHQLETMSDLSRAAQKARFAITHEFISRQDGFNAMNAFYNYKISRDQLKLMEHALLYPAIASDKADVIEVYSTDGKINDLDLIVLKDDQKFFPAYEAVILTTQEFVERHPEFWRVMSSDLEGSISEEQIRALNGQVDVQKKSVREVIANHLNRPFDSREDEIWPRVLKRTQEHSFLVSVTMLLCILTGLPLGLLALRSAPIAQTILVVSSLVQTIPSLALLCFLIPVFGIGQTPALVALYLYGLLPIVVNTYVGVSNISRTHIDTARALGMSRWQQLYWIEIPMASPHILSGIKTATILTIGTATLAALIGAGGYGAPIITGLAMNNTKTILIGALPAAAMALIAHILFQVLESLLISRGLKK
jgi:osmoprotectant transport system permease protein